MNDIFRYIKEEGDEEPVETTQEETTAAGPLVEDVEMPKAQAPAEEPAAAGLDADVVDEKLESIEAEAPAAVPSTNGTGETTTEVEDAPVAVKAEEEVPTPEAAEKAVEEESKAEPEKPKDPLPSPVVTKAPPASKPAQAPQQPGPQKPLSWASRAAAAVGSAPRPAVPVVTPKTATPPAQARAPPAAKPAAATQPTPASTPAPVFAAEKDKENNASGWQTAGDHAKRQNRPQSISAPPTQDGLAYIRNVTEKLATEELRAALEVYGPLVYFDINRSKVSTKFSYKLNSANMLSELRICPVCNARRLPGCSHRQPTPNCW